jgi:putative hydrolase of the HAD superfamily
MEGAPESVRGLGGGDVDALFVDLGDTLIRIRADRFFSRLAGLVPDLDRKAFYREVLDREVYQDFARGRMEGPEFARRVGAILGLEWSFEAFKDVWIDMMDDIPGNEEAFRRALSAVPVYVLSNTDPVHVEYIRGRFPWIKEAAGFHLSCDVGVLKPDPEFYLGALERFGLEARRVVFIDDRAENVDSAREVGLRAVLVEDESVLARVVEHLWPRAT